MHKHDYLEYLDDVDHLDHLEHLQKTLGKTEGVQDVQDSQDTQAIQDEHLRPDCSSFTLTIRSTASHQIPETVRLRRVLKRLLRQYGFTCLSIASTAARGAP